MSAMLVTRYSKVVVFDEWPTEQAGTKGSNGLASLGLGISHLPQCDYARLELIMRPYSILFPELFERTGLDL